MRTFLFSISIILFTGGNLSGQPEGFARVSSFIPVGYSILDSASGNLNKDEYTDLVLILKFNNEDIIEDTARPLLLLAGGQKGWYKLLAKNDSVVLCKDCGGAFGDPYQGITIKNGYFSIEHYGGSSWRWTRIITFKFNAITKQFILHRDAGVSFHTADVDKTTDVILNKNDFGKLPFSKFSNDKYK